MEAIVAKDMVAGEFSSYELKFTSETVGNSDMVGTSLFQGARGEKSVA